ncbi:MAG: methionyl-tRNA formyltransferase [Raoultibacter sp.]|jgi:methionyl-tRNA formyltransferase
MKLVFMGTPEFSATILEDLVEHHEVLAVYTRPDAIRGRGKDLVSSPVKRIAEEYEIPVYSPVSFKDSEAVAELAALEPEVICVAAFGLILPREVLQIPQYGCLNVHASLLPRWRGAAPVERAILADDVETGVCIMRMEEGLDTGDYCVCRTASVENKTADELSDELANLGSHALLTALVHVEAKASDWTKQDSEHISYASKLEKGELNPTFIDTAHELALKVRASSAAHPARCILAERKVTLEEVKEVALEDALFEQLSSHEQGSLVYVHKRLFLRACDAAVEIISLKPDGKQSMSAKAFAAGIPGIKQEVKHWDVLNV